MWRGLGGVSIGFESSLMEVLEDGVGVREVVNWFRRERVEVMRSLRMRISLPEDDDAIVLLAL